MHKSNHPDVITFVTEIVHVNWDSIFGICVFETLVDVCCTHFLEPWLEGVLNELSREHTLNVILVGDVPTKVLKIVLCEFILLSRLFYLYR